MIPLYVVFPVLVLVMWAAGFTSGWHARRRRGELGAAPPWPEYEAVVYPLRPGQPRHRVPRRLGVIPRRSPSRPRGGRPASYTHERITP